MDGIDRLNLLQQLVIGYLQSANLVVDESTERFLYEQVESWLYRHERPHAENIKTNTIIGDLVMVDDNTAASMYRVQYMDDSTFDAVTDGKPESDTVVIIYDSIMLNVSYMERAALTSKSVMVDEMSSL